MEIKYFGSKDEAAAEEGEQLNNLLVENKKTPILLLLSGGSSFAVLDYVGTSALGENLTISVLDERFSQDPTINNFAQLQKTDFYKLAFDAGCSFFGTIPRKDESKEELAARWEKNLHTWKQENPRGLIIATVGMGADGHTAGILPYPLDAKLFNEFFGREAWVKAYNAGAKNQFPERITTTLSFIKMIDFGFALVCDKEKQPAFENMVNKKGQLNELPALAWYTVKDIKIFTDLQ